jgi:hypothetical protein
MIRSFRFLPAAVRRGGPATEKFTLRGTTAQKDNATYLPVGRLVWELARMGQAGRRNE